MHGKVGDTLYISVNNDTSLWNASIPGEEATHIMTGECPHLCVGCCRMHPQNHSNPVIKASWLTWQDWVLVSSLVFFLSYVKIDA